MIENFDNQQYRDNLAEDIKHIPDHEERRIALEKEKQSFRYNEAEALHGEDVREKHEGVGIDPLKTFPKFFEDSKMRSLLENGNYENLNRADVLNIERSRIKIFDTDNYYILLVDYLTRDKRKALNCYKKVLEVVYRRKGSYDEKRKTVRYQMMGSAHMGYENFGHPILEVHSTGQDSFEVELRAKTNGKPLNQYFNFNINNDGKLEDATEQG